MSYLTPSNKQYLKINVVILRNSGLKIILCWCWN